jgi:hypothetical protein
MQSRRGFGWGDLAALLLSGIAATLAPLQVFLLAYVLLGPFHYLTEIAWLEKKKFYFGDGLISPRWYAILAGVLALAGAADFVLKRGLGFWIIGSLLLLSLSVWVRNVYVFAALAVAGCAVKLLSPTLVIFIAVIVPTFVHVFFFTWIFMLSGALRSSRQGMARWLNPTLVIAIPIALIVASVHYTAPGAMWVRSEALSFGPLHAYLAAHLHHTLHLDSSLLADPVVAALLRVSAFAYLFHYLNWFTKIELLSWHRISSRGWILITALYALSIGLYAWSFTVGFLVANFLSLLHVLLEFPLDWQAMHFVVWGWHDRRLAVNATAQQTTASNAT